MTFAESFFPLLLQIFLIVFTVFITQLFIYLYSQHKLTKGLISELKNNFNTCNLKDNFNSSLSITEKAKKDGESGSNVVFPWKFQKDAYAEFIKSGYILSFHEELNNKIGELYTNFESLNFILEINIKNIVGQPVIENPKHLEMIQDNQILIFKTAIEILQHIDELTNSKEIKDFINYRFIKFITRGY